MEISDDQLIGIIKNSPIVTINLIIKNEIGKILLGLRKNEPAKNSWFVPSGRIRKDEDLDHAFKRIIKNELCLDFDRNQARFIGIFEQKFEKNFFQKPNIGTHCIALAYEIRPKNNPEFCYNTQHHEYKWFTKSEAISNNHVHNAVFHYFEDQTLTESQYEILNARRDSFNNLLWQTPALSLTAQAFLFTIALNSAVSQLGRMISALLSLITAVASALLLIKHRFGEKTHATLLEDFERKQGIYQINQKFESKRIIERIPGFYVWLGLLILFAIIALIIIMYPELFIDHNHFLNTISTI